MEIKVKSQQWRSRRVLRLVTTIFSVVATLLGLAFIIPTALGLQRYVITGTSMTGTIDIGSIAFEEVVPVSELEVGDVITYMPPAGSSVDGMVTHRIVKINGDTFRTKGDAVPQRDPWKFQLNAPDQARVKFSVPYVGWPFIVLADRTTRIAVIGVPAGIITLISFGQFLRALRRKPEPNAGPDGVTTTTPEPDLQPAPEAAAKTPSMAGG